MLSRKKQIGRIEAVRMTLQKRIETGVYQPGQKIDTVKALSEELKAGKETVQLALAELEAAGFITSIHRCGVFVNENFREKKKTVRLALVFPVEEISQEKLPPENLGIAIGIQHGLLCGGEQYGVNVEFVYAPEETGFKETSAIVKKLRKYDVLAFIGAQLEDLKRIMAKKMPVFCYDFHSKVEGQYYKVHYNSENMYASFAKHLLDCNCKTIGVYSLKESDDKPHLEMLMQARGQLFAATCEKYGLKVEKQHVISFDRNQELQSMVRKSLSADHPDFIFCNNTYLIPEVYRACIQNRIVIGEDLKIGGHGTGHTFQGIVPTLTYLRTPVFECGVEIVKQACELIKGNQDAPMVLVQPELVIGESTSGIK